VSNIDWSTGYEEIADESPPKGESASNGHDPHSPDLWPVMAPAAFHGLAGEVAARLSPHTESDPVALLVQYLTSFGNAVGRGPYYQVEGDRHFGNLFVVMVGETSKSRKGTSAGRIRSIFNIADPDWVRGRVLGGMSSGEGVIFAVRDAVYAVKKGNEELVDLGVSDKRLLLDEREFFQALAVLRREGNILSGVIRDAWDCRNLATLTKRSPMRATDPFISIIGHITADEIRQSLDHTSMANGYANRFLFICVRRGKLLPHGGAVEDTVTGLLGARTLEAIAAARTIGRLTMTPESMALWEEVYPKLSEGLPGLLGAITGRAEAQTVRLALIYALLDRASQIDVVHLNAALALWAYCEVSARYVFGDLIGDPVADEILRALRQLKNKTTGLTRTQIRDLFGRNQSGERIGAALGKLLAAGKAYARHDKAAHGPRPIEIWFAL
jgi:hypothetical protein